MAGAPGPSQHPVDPSLGSAALHAPWRLEYIESLGKGADAESPTPTAARAAAGDAAGSGSFLRDYWLAPAEDEKNHVIARVRAPAGGAADGDCSGMILLNMYPYANGHLLVALGEARPKLMDYGAPQRAALWRLTDIAAGLMQETLEPQGINIGVNQGRAAGAGVPGHLHVHLVPRWSGDVNFMAVVGRVRVIPSSLEAMAKRYREAWERVRGRLGC